MQNTQELIPCRQRCFNLVIYCIDERLCCNISYIDRHLCLETIHFPESSQMNTIAITPVDIACCAPEGLRAPIERSEAEQLAVLLKAISDPTRIQLISRINASSNAEACVCDLTDPLGLTQPTVSHHLKVLTDAGLINREKRGTWVWYSMNQERWQQLATLFEV